MLILFRLGFLRGLPGLRIRFRLSSRFPRKLKFFLLPAPFLEDLVSLVTSQEINKFSSQLLVLRCFYHGDGGDSQDSFFLRDLNQVCLIFQGIVPRFIRNPGIEFRHRLPDACGLRACQQGFHNVILDSGDVAVDLLHLFLTDNDNLGALFGQIDKRTNSFRVAFSNDNCCRSAYSPVIDASSTIPGYACMKSFSINSAPS